MVTVPPDWDVLVVGAGPAGLAAAHAAAGGGARTLVLERARLPRYKTCGGGLIGASLAAVPAGTAVPVQTQVRAATFTQAGRRGFTRAGDGPLVRMVMRDEFDAALARTAAAAGAEVREARVVRQLAADEEGVRVRLADGATVRARVVVGADGSSGICARYVGVRYQDTDLGLEVELALPRSRRQDWAERLLIDWGPLPGSYGWVFPKRDRLSVGVIAGRGRGDATRAYLRELTARLRLDELAVLVDSGHLTRCRAEDSPLRRGRVLVAGDAAGLLEPWTREGISAALRSGMLAGTAAARAATAGGPDAERLLDAYPDQILAAFAGEMRAGRRLLAAFAGHPGACHAALASPPGWAAFRRFCRGETTLAQLAGHRLARAGLALLRA